MGKWTRIAKTILKKNKVERITPSNLKICYKAYKVMNMVWLLGKRETEQCNRVESSELDLHNYGCLIFEKGAKNSVIKAVFFAIIHDVGTVGYPYANEWTFT